MRTKLVPLLAVSAALASLAPAALGNDGDRDGRHHHRWGVLLLGSVTAVDAGDDVIAVKVRKATRGGKSLVGDTVTVKVSRLWVHDSNDDDRHDLADLSDGEKVLVKTRRRFIDYDAERITAAKVIDLPLRWARCSTDGCHDR